MSFGADAYAFDGGDGMDFDINDMEEVNIEDFNGGNFDDSNIGGAPLYQQPIHTRLSRKQPADYVREDVDFFDVFSKYISLTFLIAIIALIFIQPRVKYMLFGRLLGYDKKILIQVVQAISIGVVSSFSAFHTLN